jgi:hypothetical protein
VVERRRVLRARCRVLRQHEHRHVGSRSRRPRPTSRTRPFYRPGSRRCP